MANIYGGIQRSNVTLDTMRELQAESAQERLAEQVDTANDLFDVFAQSTSQLAEKIKTHQKTIKSSKSRIQKMMKMGDKLGKVEKVKMLDDTASKFQQKNRELDAKALVALRESIKPGDTKEEIMAKIAKAYEDPSLADDVFDFLLETTEGELHETIKELKEEFTGKFGREIAAGKNIAEEARAAADKGLGTPTSLRDQYRDLTGNPRDSGTLFNELSQKYEFKDLKKMCDFFLHSLGADMKSKGPSIPRGELHRLITETRNLQSILGVYRFFSGRMHLMQTLFQKEGMEFPANLTFEAMTKQFMNLVGDRYPSSSKAMQTAVKLGLDKWVMAKIIALSQFRDAIREVAMEKIYKSLQHRDECYMALIEALEDLEDELEEELKRREEQEGGGDEEEEEEEEEEKK